METNGCLVATHNINRLSHIKAIARNQTSTWVGLGWVVDAYAHVVVRWFLSLSILFVHILGQNRWIPTTTLP